MILSNRMSTCYTEGTLVSDMHIKKPCRIVAIEGTWSQAFLSCAMALACCHDPSGELRSRHNTQTGASQKHIYDGAIHAACCHCRGYRTYLCSVLEKHGARLRPLARSLYIGKLLP